MSKAKIPYGENYLSIDPARASIAAFVAKTIDISFFLFLLGKARAGLKVEIIILDSIFSRLEINGRYFQHLTKAGGAFYRLSSSHLPPRARGSFVIIDDQRVISPPFHQREAQPDFRDADENPQALRFFRELFLRLRENGFQALPNESDPTSSSPIPELSSEWIKNGGASVVFSTDCSTVLPNEPCQLHWSAPAASSVNIQPFPGLVAKGGSQLFRLSESTTFTLTAELPEGAVCKVLRINVKKQLRLSYRLLTIDPLSGKEILLEGQPHLPHHYGIMTGQPITIKWQAEDATSVTFSPLGEVTLAGEHTFYPEGLNSLDLRARNNIEEIGFPIIVNTFIPPSLPTLAEVPEKALKISSHVDFDKISLPDWEGILGDFGSSDLDSLLEDSPTEEWKKEWEARQRPVSIWQHFYRWIKPKADD